MPESQEKNAWVTPVLEEIPMVDTAAKPSSAAEAAGKSMPVVS